jgi:hypothetical protein
MLEMYPKLGHGHLVAYAFQIRYLLVILSLDTMNSELLRALLKTAQINTKTYGKITSLIRNTKYVILQKITFLLKLKVIKK